MLSQRVRDLRPVAVRYYCIGGMLNYEDIILLGEERVLVVRGARGWPLLVRRDLVYINPSQGPSPRLFASLTGRVRHREPLSQVMHGHEPEHSHSPHQFSTPAWVANVSLNSCVEWACARKGCDTHSEAR